MVKYISRFLMVLCIGGLLGGVLYLSMHYVAQPLMNRVDPEPFDQTSIETEPEPIDLPSLSEMPRRTLSVAKNGVVFVIVTIGVLGTQKVFSRVRRGSTRIDQINKDE